MSAAPYETSASLTIVEGMAASGKTELIASRVREIAQNGAEPADIVVLAATPASARALKSRVARACESLGAGNSFANRVTSVQEYAIDALRSPRAVEKTGREGRLLLGFERSILFEDLKTTGVAPKRLSGMLSFFYRSLSELEPMDTPWFFSDEEENVFRMLESRLSRLRAFLPCEIGRAAFGLAMDRATSDLCAARHVLVDDFQMLSKASQCFVVACAVETIFVTADRLAGVSPVESFPYPGGIEELRQANPSCRRIDAGPSHARSLVAQSVELIARDIAGIASSDGNPDASARPSTEDDASRCAAGEPGGAFEFALCRRPDDERENVVERVISAIDAGRSPEQIALAAPRVEWARKIAHELERRGIPTARFAQCDVGGDVRQMDRCAEARVVTLLRLAANEKDFCALRCWIGFGDHLARSWAAGRIMDGAIGLSIEGVTHASLHEGSNDVLLGRELAGADRAIGEARRMLRAIEGLRGQTLVDAIKRALGIADGRTPVVDRIARSLSADATAGDICRAIDNAHEKPQFPEEGVRIGPLEAFAGESIPVVIISGLVNGFTPARDYFDPAVIEIDKRPELLRRASTSVYVCAGAATEALILTAFEEATLVESEALGLKSYRVRLKNRERVCEIHPSETIRSIIGG